MSGVRLPTTPPRSSLAALAVVAAGLAASGAVAAFDADAIDTADRVLPRLHSLIVSRRGEVIFERYYNKAQGDAAGQRQVGLQEPDRGARRHRHRPQAPSPACATAVRDHLVSGLAKDPDLRAKRAITVEDLLEMRSGLEGTSGREYGAWVSQRQLGAIRAEPAR